MTDLATIRIPVDSTEVSKAISTTQRLEATLVKLEKSLRSGKITSSQYNAELGRQAKTLRDLGVSYNQANSQVRRFAANLRGLSSTELDNIGRGFQASQKGARQFELAVQQAGFQVGDFAVQVASGTNPLVAFAQQATQLVGFFGGPWGAAIGAGIAVASGLAIAFMGISEAAKTADETSQDLADTLSLLEETTDRLNLSVDEMIRKYGEAAGTVREFAIAQAESAVAQAEQRLGDQILLLNEMMNQYTAATNAVNDFGEALDYSEVLRTITDDFKVSSREAMQLFDAFVAIENATTFAQQRAGLLEVDRILKDANVSAGDLPPELNRALFELRALVLDADALAAALDRARSAARNMTFGNLGALSGLSGSELIPPPAPLEDPEKESPGAAKRDPLEELKKQLDLERELVGTSEAYQRVRRALGDQFAKTSPEIVSGLVEQIQKTEELIEIENRRKSLINTVSNALESGFMSMVDGTKSVKDAFKSMAADIIRELYRVLVVQRMVGGITSSLGLFAGPSTGSFGLPFGGSFATGGSVMPNKSYLVGENGPELVIPRHSGTVVNANQTAAMGSGNGDITVQNNITVTGSDAAMVRAEVAKMIPQITNATKAAVIDAKQRGGQMAAAFR